MEIILVSIKHMDIKCNNAG